MQIRQKSIDKAQQFLLQAQAKKTPFRSKDAFKMIRSIRTSSNLFSSAIKLGYFKDNGGGVLSGLRHDIRTNPRQKADRKIIRDQSRFIEAFKRSSRHQKESAKSCSGIGKDQIVFYPVGLN